MTTTATSNLALLDKYIEKNIEQKLNTFFETLPNKNDIKSPKMIYDLTIFELYNGTLQTTIDIINDITKLNTQQNMTSVSYRNSLYNIFLKDDRKIYVGILLVILSFIIYFIDGTDT